MKIITRIKQFLNKDNIEKHITQYKQTPVLLDYQQGAEKIDGLGGLEYCRQQKISGMTQKELAAKLNIKQPALSAYCKRNGCSWKELAPSPARKTAKLPKPGKENRVATLEKLGGVDYIIQQTRQGKTYAQISAELGQPRNDNWISNYMRYRGYNAKKTLPSASETCVIDDAGGLTFLRTELASKSVGTIAKELGIKQKTVYNYIYSKGYNMRTIRRSEKVAIPEGVSNWKMYEEWDYQYTIDQFQKAVQIKGINETAKALNCTPNTLQLYCVLRGIPV